MTDWRERCAELLQALETEGYAHWTVTPDKDELCLRTRAELAQPYSDPTEERRLGYLKGLEDSAHAALAKPEPEGLTEDEIEEAAKLIYASMRFAVPDSYYTRDWVERGNSLMQDEARRTARALLTRWGRPAIQLELGEGEVKELVRRLRDWQSIPLLEERERIADLLQQLSTITTEDLNND